MNKKYKILAISLGIVVIIILLLSVWSKLFTKDNKTNTLGHNSAPEFMTAQEKVKFQVPDNLKAQIINRDEKGDITVYKIVNSDKDVVSNPSQISPISPRHNNATK